MIERIPEPRTEAWVLLGAGDEPTARSVIARQDTAELAVWRRDAARMIENIADELEVRDGEDHYPSNGMREDPRDADVLSPAEPGRNTGLATGLMESWRGFDAADAGPGPGRGVV